MADSASLQISSRFDALTATTVQITLPSDAEGIEEAEVTRRLSLLPGVLAVGSFTPVSETSLAVRASSAREPEARSVPIIVASVNGLRAADPIVQAGRLPTTWVESHDLSLVVLGEGPARQFKVGPEFGRTVIMLNSQPFTVSAVVADRGNRARLSPSVIVSPQGVRRLTAAPLERTMLIRTRVGAGPNAARWGPLAAYPENPSLVSAQIPPDPRQLRGRISSDTRTLLLALAIITIVSAAVGIANTMLVSVWERRREIGLRRALGASRASIGALFLTESGLVGTVGGVLGSALGVLAGAGLCLARGWEYSLPTPVVGAPLLGTAVGILAGLHPAVRATHVDPIETLRL